MKSNLLNPYKTRSTRDDNQTARETKPKGIPGVKVPYTVGSVIGNGAKMETGTKKGGGETGRGGDGGK